MFYVREISPNEIKVTSGFYDTIKTSCKKLFEDLDKQVEEKDSFEMLESAKE